jgi:hypothetical protein
MALIICDSCGKQIKSKWFPKDWIIVKYDNVLLNRVLCDKCKENVNA